MSPRAVWLPFTSAWRHTWRVIAYGCEVVKVGDILVNDSSLAPSPILVNDSSLALKRRLTVESLEAVVAVVTNGSACVTALRSAQTLMMVAIILFSLARPSPHAQRSLLRY